MLQIPTLLIHASLAVALAGVVLGQNAPEVPPNAPYGISISPANAKKVAAAAIAKAKENKWEMAVAIVDTGGHLVYFERMDDTQVGSVQVAIDKAQSAVLFRRSTKVFMDALAGGGAGVRMLALTGAVPVEGGIPLVMDGKVVGAIGASGGTGEQDGMTATAGAASMAKK